MAHIELISLETLLAMKINKQDFKLVDVLPEDTYAQGHIPDAINIPLQNISNHAEKQLKKHDTIVVYCSNYACKASTKAAETLLNMGYSNTVDFKAGRKKWAEEGLGLESDNSKEQL